MMTKFFITCCTFLIGFAFLPVAAYEPCDIKLTNLSETRGWPGDELVLFGKWGHSKGKKVPAINKGDMNRLEILSWFPTRMRVRIPDNLEPGIYKVGVYCNDLSEGGAYSSNWLDFEIRPNEESAPSEAAPIENEY